MDGPVTTAVPARMSRLPTWLISQTALHASRLVADGMAALGARGYHYRVLAGLAEFGPVSQAALSRHTGIDVSDIVATVNELTGSAAVERAADPTDRRRNIITITPAGRRQLDELDGKMAEIQDALLAPLTPGERAELTRLLTTLLGHHSASGQDRYSGLG
jgi:MarR family transcriptional regulator, lower aerobic nicotinate degradation pathway regulator